MDTNAGSERTVQKGLQRSFPLTPALSPREREKRIPRSAQSRGCRGRPTGFVFIRVHSWFLNSLTHSRAFVLFEAMPDERVELFAQCVVLHAIDDLAGEGMD